MELIQTLGTAMGFGVLSGVNLYLLMVLIGLGIRLHLVVLGDKYSQLAVLGTTWVIVVASILYLIEFFADKIPGLDSAWDAVHTLIRPVGGMLIALGSVGALDQDLNVLAALVGGSAAFSSHVAKSGTRLLVNASPEPFTNMMLSFGEDLAVVGGTAIAVVFPCLAFVVFSLVIVAIWILVPRVFKAAQKVGRRLFDNASKLKRAVLK